MMQHIKHAHVHAELFSNRALSSRQSSSVKETLCNPDLWHKTLQEPVSLQWKTMHPHLEGFNLSSSLFKTAQANRMNTNALCVSHKTGNRRIKRFICARVRESTDPVSVRESGKMAVKEKGNYLLLPNHQVRHLSLVPVSYGFSVWHWKLFGSI